MTQLFATYIFLISCLSLTRVSCLKSKHRDHRKSEAVSPSLLQSGGQTVEELAASESVGVSAQSESSLPSYSSALLAAFPGADFVGFTVDTLSHTAGSSTFLTVQTRDADEVEEHTKEHSLLRPFRRGPAVIIGALAGAIVGGIAGTQEFGGAVGIPCGFAGGILGGGLAWGWHWALSPDDSDRASPKKQKETQKKAAKAAEPKKVVFSEAIELPQPALDKFRQLALTAVALSGWEKSLARLDKNATEEKIEAADQKEAKKALGHIAKRLNTSRKEPMNATLDDHEELQEVLGEGETSEFMTAEVARANNALITANDVARITSKNGTRMRGEDLGPAGDIDSFQGDMIPQSKQQLALFQMLSSSLDNPHGAQAAGSAWTDARVAFCFASDVSKRTRHIFLAAANQYSSAVPCLDFVDVGWKSGTSTSPEDEQECNESPAIFVQSNPNEGCYSFVGMVERKGFASQRLQLQDPGCVNIGTAAHEIGHALGMAHEQSRPDRDKFVKVHWDNIAEDRRPNFDVIPTAYTEESYDFLSVMHYDRFAFASDPAKPTVEFIGKGVHDELGQRTGLSRYDIRQVEAMYKSKDKACASNAFAGMGCVNKPDDSGEDPCSGITKCNSKAASHCCACGGGLNVQCYEGQDCPKGFEGDPLPTLSAHECIEDQTSLFAGSGYPCVFTNTCKFKVEINCPGFECHHHASPKNYEAARCQGSFMTQICTAPTQCRVTRIEE